MDFLMCDEVLSFSTPSPSHSPNNVINDLQVNPTNSTFKDPINAEEYDNTLKNYLNKEKNFKPLNGYLEKLSTSSNFSAARFKAVDWIIKARGRLNLQYGTAFAAMNYIDRFLSMNLHINIWETWMAELIAITCLSIACKVDEVSGPKLYHFQTEDLEHAYEPDTIKSMESRILKALDYRLVCVTSYSYVGILVHQIDSPHPALMNYTVEFLLRGLLEDKLIGCSAIAIATAAVQCSIEKVMPFEYVSQYYSALQQLVPGEYEEEKEMCLLLMKEFTEASYFCTPMSLYAVPGKRRTNAAYVSVDVDGCFACNNDRSQVLAWKKHRLT